ncbi:hypothetical protein AOQ84DRAFT_58744 [Glonium stellatum]|uniref:Uncharacterized protein n=1 Tax=Glonium stellatum TaxID=574774 RepID=A0A8E2JRZ1_9PEZI|nr:hypothetical protein AOQ84DRAFT_58744 [Glonium stellatum]
MQSTHCRGAQGIYSHPCHPCHPSISSALVTADLLASRVACQCRCETKDTGECCWAMSKRGSRCITMIVPLFIHTMENLTCIALHRVQRFTALGLRRYRWAETLRSTRFDGTSLQSKGLFGCRNSLTVQIVHPSRRITVHPPTLRSSHLSPKLLPLGQQAEVQAANANANARRRLPQFAETVWGKGYSRTNPSSVRVLSHEGLAHSISQYSD